MRRKDRDLGAQAALEILDECEYATISCVYYADEIDANCDNLAQENSANLDEIKDLHTNLPATSSINQQYTLDTSVNFSTNSDKITDKNLDTSKVNKTCARFSMDTNLDEISSQILAKTANTKTNLFKIKSINFHKFSNKNTHFSDTLNTKSNMNTLTNFHTLINLRSLNTNAQTRAKFDIGINLNQISSANPVDKDTNLCCFSTHKNKVSTKFSTQSDQICTFKPEQIFTNEISINQKSSRANLRTKSALLNSQTKQIFTPRQPQIFSIPISIVRENESIFIHGAPSGAKAKLLQNGREVTIVAVSFNHVPTPSKSDFNAHSKDGKWLGSNVFTTEYKSAIATAKAYEITDPKAKFHALKILSQKYVASAQMRAFDVAAMHSLNITNIYELKIISLSAKAKILPKK